MHATHTHPHTNASLPSDTCSKLACACIRTAQRALIACCAACVVCLRPFLPQCRTLPPVRLLAHLSESPVPSCSRLVQWRAWSSVCLCHGSTACRLCRSARALSCNGVFGRLRNRVMAHLSESLTCVSIFSNGMPLFSLCIPRVVSWGRYGATLSHSSSNVTPAPGPMS